MDGAWAEPISGGEQMRGLLKDTDLTPTDVRRIVALAATLKAARRSGEERPRLTGKSIALIFEKPSTRTRSAFEVAAAHQGAAVAYLDLASSHLGERESVQDTARVLGRLHDGVGYRARYQTTLETFARHAGVPVWNALTNQWHPTQAIADMLTVREDSPKPWSEISLAFVGDATANVANSLRVTGALLGMDVRIVSPAALQSSPPLLDVVARICRGTGGRVIDTEDIEDGVRGVDFVYTDAWIRIGEPIEAWRDRISLLLPYRVDRGLLERTKNPDVKYLHCLPATHDTTTASGQQFWQETGLESAEVTDEVFESAASIVFEQAENRMHAIKALMITDLARRPDQEPSVGAL